MEQMQMDFDAANREVASEPKILSVSEVNRAVRTTLESNYKLLWVKGEISNFKAHTSGHFYFSLKDSKAQINAVMFRGFNQNLKFKPEAGLEVIIRGKVTVYEPRGTYQIFCELMEPVGAGALQLAFEQLKKKLHAEGLFDPAKKRLLPPLPRHVAVVTSPTGAAVRDILNVLGRRFRGLRVTIVPALVQGDGAPASIIKALRLAQQLPDVDAMIIGRGGGSIEDLWAFNDEVVARTIAACRVPIISAVGHEIDFTIADFVADLRAPTPSAAAELVCKNASEIADKVLTLEARLARGWTHQMALNRQRLLHAAKRLVDPKRRLQDLNLRCDELTQRLEMSVRRDWERRRQHVKLLATKLPLSLKVVEAKRAEWARLSSVLDSLSPLKVVERGYSITQKNKTVIKASSQLKEGDVLQLTFAKGRAQARVEKILE